MYIGTLFTNLDAKGMGWLGSKAHGDRDTFSVPFLKACNLFESPQQQHCQKKSWVSKLTNLQMLPTYEY